MEGSGSRGCPPTPLGTAYHTMSRTSDRITILSHDTPTPPPGAGGWPRPSHVYIRRYGDFCVVFWLVVCWRLFWGWRVLVRGWFWFWVEPSLRLGWAVLLLACRLASWTKGFGLGEASPLGASLREGTGMPPGTPRGILGSPHLWFTSGLCRRDWFLRVSQSP